MKNLLIILILVMTSLCFAQERLIVLGGSDEIPKEAVSQFMDWAKGKDSKVLIIPWATTGTDYAQIIKNQLRPLASKDSFTIAPTFPLNPKKKSIFLSQLKQATGVFFTGGDQERILKTIKDDEIRKAIVDKFKAGTVFAGTSAGTAIMSKIAIIAENDSVDGKPNLETGEGLCLLPSNVIVDQHFVVRNREARLRLLVLANPGSVGIGIDEPTGFIVENGLGKVVGPGSVVILRQDDKSILKHGDSIRLK